MYNKNFLFFFYKFIIFKEKYCEIRDSITYYNDFSLIQIKCPSCGKYSHDIFECPLIVYNNRKFEKIDKYRNENKQLKRLQRKRKTKIKVNSLLSKNNILIQQQKAQIYFFDGNSIIKILFIFFNL